MKCALCKDNEANKKNTHYLTDSIIRSALNERGSNQREKGLHFDVSNNQIFSDFSFQRNTSVEKLEEVLGRSASQEEIGVSIQSNAFSVDHVFCSDCEKIFTMIENKFIKDILPKFRKNKHMANTSAIQVKESTLFRLFYLLQIWRTSVCEEIFILSDETSEKLRLLILQGLNANKDILKSFPLSITFLYTGDEPMEYTSNRVGVANGNSPHLLFMNVFIIQFFEKQEDVQFLDFYGLNDLEDYLKYVNYQEEIFTVKVFSYDQRKYFFQRLDYEEKIKPTIDYLNNAFSTLWIKLKGAPPSQKLRDEYIEEVTNWDHIPLAQRLDKDRIQKFTVQFVYDRINRYE